ncbi:MAG: translation initiation factor IF-3 [Candidatus Midichloria mitochondrii]|nr:translation initiation factor IF-3 [Candidatus Midichloria mitochondrii]MDJ1288286.1 translation initiation factor IF-3 [Candidatus Midichloria mitochondrii]MDJ1299145.1 translation initiation factor IF-3 [Candidatus Midichloria mitochondrii]MDJ1313157.1 translation initiation factor IF-3 [Candidatus Midichloria mitochondrii]MDJ1583757.1 translation initiation factor IF-3 [Candidatus Midichloria mitochondrii]
MIDENGNMVGILQAKEAFSLAQQRGFDLVEISPNAAPPICKIMDFGKYKYEQQKKQHAARLKQKTVETKELKLRPTIAEGDYAVKLRSLKKFIDNGNKVRVLIVFKGREITHNEIGFALANKLVEDTSEFAKPDSLPKLEGKQILMTFSALK